MYCNLALEDGFWRFIFLAELSESVFFLPIQITECLQGGHLTSLAAFSAADKFNSIQFTGSTCETGKSHIRTLSDENVILCGTLPEVNARAKLITGHASNMPTNFICIINTFNFTSPPQVQQSKNTVLLVLNSH